MQIANATFQVLAKHMLYVCCSCEQKAYQQWCI